jgi:hypothetical protein
MLSLPTAVRPIVISAVLGAAGARAATAQAPALVGIASDSTPVVSDSTPPASDSAVAPTGPLLSREQSGIRADGDDAAPADTGQVRPRAVEYSEGYGKRLEIHRIASYAELPLFAAEFIVGQKLLSDERNTGTAPGGLKTTHTILAGGLGVLFAVNTVTGVWNMVEARHDPAGRTRRTIHGLSMLVADAGFLWTASLANGARHSDAQATRHRNVAIASISVATASTLMMWLWKN